MGKAQSKRSVDITTEVKKDDVEEGTGKMEKIEDVDQLKPQINGDTHHTDNEGTEKVGEEGTENEKDLSTEKEQKPHIEGGGDEPAAVVAATTDENKTVENGENGAADDTLNESKNINETSATESADSSKKPKKEKVKKKWSFRSISFGKKDKQKPPKKDEGTVNGECEKVPEETTEDPAATTKEQTNEEKPAESVEAAAATPAAAAEASTPAEEKPAPTETDKTEKPEEKAEPAPVVNGNEPAKEETITAESNKTDVVEPITNGTDDTTKKDDAAKPAEDAPKESGTESSVAATKIEENGVGDHEPAVESKEVSQPEHKTIEDVKAEQQTEVNSEVTSETAPGTVTVAE